MDKLEIIKRYLLKGSDRKAKFEISWDIAENFEKIKLSMRKQVLTELVSKIRNHEAFKDYEIKDEGLLECKKLSPLRIYKKDWIVNGIVPLSYAVESDTNGRLNLYFGIEKWDNDKGIPFRGNWEKEKLPNNWKDILIKIKENLPKDWKVGDAWIIWKSFDGYYRGACQKDFYMEIIENGYSSVADYYFKELLNLKNRTEELVGEFVEYYKNYEK